MTARRISGAILFIDIDEYLTRVQDMNGQSELKWIEPAYKAVHEESQILSIQPVRSFGDAFLLFLEDPPNLYKKKSLSFLRRIHRRFSILNLSFRAVAAGGQFYVGPELWKPNWNDARISGALANFAGKKIRSAPKGSAVFLWPKKLEIQELTFRELSEGSAIEETIIPIEKL